MERRFACTACGKCCAGWLPLTLADALAHAGRFPLALIWTPVRQGSSAYAVTARLGTTVRLPGRKTAAVRITPTGYLPPSFPCPELTTDNLCGIHAGKPSRCRTMPFFPYREDGDQADLLIPRPGWACDISPAAPVVYRDGRIMAPDDFNRERADLERQAALLRAHADGVLPVSPTLQTALAKAAGKPRDGHVVTSFASLFPRLPRDQVISAARGQLPVLLRYAERTAGEAGLAEYHRHYLAWAGEMERVIGAAAGGSTPS